MPRCGKLFKGRIIAPGTSLVYAPARFGAGGRLRGMFRQIVAERRYCSSFFFAAVALSLFGSLFCACGRGDDCPFAVRMFMRSFTSRNAKDKAHNSNYCEQTYDQFFLHKISSKVFICRGGRKKFTVKQKSAPSTEDTPCIIVSPIVAAQNFPKSKKKEMQKMPFCKFTCKMIAFCVVL